MFYTSTRTVASHALDSQVEDLPLGLDPTTTPIIATHFFGWRRPSAEIIDFDLIRLARALHGLGKALGMDIGSWINVLQGLSTEAGAASGRQPCLSQILTHNTHIKGKPR